jgi:hypothetical protein
MEPNFSAEKKPQTKEVKTMRYEKPELVAVHSACSAVQGHPELGKSHDTADNSQQEPSIPAYEADE